MNTDHKCSRHCGCALAERFWDKVDRRGYAECWPWLMKSTSRGGYGKFTLRPGELPGETSSKWVDAHRLAFRLIHGRWPDPQGLHGCDVPACCNAENPAHIHEGTQARNVREALDRDRMFTDFHFDGADHPRARFSADEVAAMRSLREQFPSTAALARELGLPRSTVDHVISGRRYS